MNPEIVTAIKRPSSLSPSSSSSSSTSQSSSEDFFEVGTAKLSESALSSNPEDGQLVSEHGAEKNDLSISLSAHEQHNEVSEQKLLPLPIPINTSEQKSRQQSPVGGEFGNNHGQCEEVSGPMTLPLPPPASASTSEPSLNQLSEQPQSTPDKDPGISSQTEKCCKYMVSTAALPPTSPVSASEPSRNNVTATESPPVQIMERRGSEPDPYRIPASIFATSNPKASMEWSMQSNESLFSIHMASMSYTKEQISFFSKSGELGLPGDPTTPGPLCNFSSSHQPTSKIEELSPKMGNLGEDLSVTEAAAETMKEVMMANASQKGQGKEPPTLWAPNSCSISLRSEESMGSHKSFAFPILTKGEGLQCGSVRKVSHSQRSHPQTSLQPETPQPPKPQASNAAQRPWFSCFPCCPYCS